MSEDRGLGFLYGTGLGRLCLGVLTRPWLSRLAGAFLSTGISRAMVPGFIRRNGIDMADYAPQRYASFNDFFTRELKDGARPVDMAPQTLVAPCDSRVSVYAIDPGSRMTIKGQPYTVADLLGMTPESLSDGFLGGTALVFRLCVDDYHRYIYFDGGSKGENIFIPGRLHTVRPAALGRVRVLAQNCREVNVLDTDNFGRAAQVEVGAMMVGRIQNHHGACRFDRGREKGMFLFGGSTVVLLLEQGRARLREDLEQARDGNREIRVRLGETIGRAQAE